MIDEVFAPGMSAMAAPVLRRKDAIGVISIAGPRIRLTSARMHELAPALLAAALPVAAAAEGVFELSGLDAELAPSPPPPEAFPTDQIPVPDRWRLIESLGLVKERWWDPYNQNTYKGDRPINPDKVPWLPIKGDDWFFVANAVSDTVFEPRSFPIPVGVQTTEDPDRNDVFGNAFSQVFSQTFIAGFALLKGSTTFKPPTIEYRVTLAYNVNYVDVPERRVLFVEPSRPSHRLDQFLGVQEAFVDYHFSQFDNDRFDFISIRAGIQPFQSDFRGFLFNDQQLGVRLFGSRDNNRFQFNLGAFWRLEKDTNSGLNAILRSPRDDFVFVANAYRQDFLIPALTSQITVVYNMNREADDIQIDTNGFPVRPALLGTLRGREYDVVYLGYNVDGRIGRVNLTGSFYWALGEDRNSFFTDRPADINAQFAALEASYDRDWMRFRLSAAYASGARTAARFGAITLGLGLIPIVLAIIAGLTILALRRFRPAMT